jgi:hypothetical protein
MSAAVDPYATAKANLRDNVKTLVAVFGAVAGILLAGTPFSAFGTLQGSRLGLAFAALVGAVVLLGWALKILLEILTPTLAYARWLRDDFAVASLTDPDERKDVPELIREFRRSRAALLPDESGPRGTIASIEDLVSAINFYWQHAQIAAAPAVSEQAQLSAEQNRAFWQIYFDALSDINHWAGFIRFHHRIRIGIDKVLGVGFLALLCIALFAWATGAPKSEVASRGTVIIGETRGPAPVAKGEPLEPILFKTGKYKLSKDAADRIGEARDRLRQHSEEGLIIYAYTDTQGSDSFNSLLAQNRAKAVVHALLGTGGIAASRVFVSELSITDLPVLTLANTDEANNRSVFLATVQLPRRW